MRNIYIGTSVSFLLVYKSTLGPDERNQCLGLPDPDPLVRGTDPAQDPDPSLFS
jgi:hypothetical protein